MIEQPHPPEIIFAHNLRPPIATSAYHFLDSHWVAWGLRAVDVSVIPSPCYSHLRPVCSRVDCRVHNSSESCAHVILCSNGLHSHSSMEQAHMHPANIVGSHSHESMPTRNQTTLGHGARAHAVTHRHSHELVATLRLNDDPRFVGIRILQVTNGHDTPGVI